MKHCLFYGILSGLCLSVSATPNTKSLESDNFVLSQTQNGALTDPRLSLIDEAEVACLCPRDGSLVDLEASRARGGECSDVPIYDEDMYCLDCCSQRQFSDLQRQAQDNQRQTFVDSYYACLDFLQTLESRDLDSLSRNEIYRKLYCQNHPLKSIMEPPPQEIPLVPIVGGNNSLKKQGHTDPI